MNDWLEVILALLRSGVTVHIDVKIRADNPDNLVEVTCGHCDWRGVYPDQKTAQRAKRAHHQHCTAYAQQMQWIAPSED